MFLVLLVWIRINEIEMMQHVFEKSQPSTHIHPRSDLMCFMHNYVFVICLICTQPIFVFGGNPILTASFTLFTQLALPQWYSSVWILWISIGPLNKTNNNTHTLFLVWNPVTHHYRLGFQNVLVSLTYRLRCDSDFSFLCIITDMVAMRFWYNLSDAV